MQLFTNTIKLMTIDSSFANLVKKEIGEIPDEDAFTSTRKGSIGHDVGRGSLTGTSG